MKRYKLLKDATCTNSIIKQETIFEKHGRRYEDPITKVWFVAYFVEENPEWFSLIEDKEWKWTDKLVMEFAIKWLNDRVAWAIMHDYAAAPIPIQLEIEKVCPTMPSNHCMMN